MRTSPPLLPDGDKLLTCLLLHVVSITVVPQVGLMGRTPAEHLEAGLLWSLCTMPFVAVTWGTYQALAWLQRRGKLDLGRPAWRGWLIYVSSFYLTGLVAAVMREQIRMRLMPTTMPTPSWVGLCSMGGIGLAYVLLLSQLASQRQREERRREVRRAHAAMLARSRMEVVATDDQQRQALAEVLHGRFQSLLVVANFHAAAAAGAGDRPADQAEHLGRARETLALLGAEARATLEGEADPHAERLDAAVEELVERFRTLCPLELVIDPAARAAAVAPPAAAAALQLVTEALLNAYRHAGPCHIRVSLLREAEGLALTVTDDGRGFDPAQASQGLGLRALAQPLVALGGACVVQSRPQAGTTMALAVPAAG